VVFLWILGIPQLILRRVFVGIRKRINQAQTISKAEGRYRIVQPPILHHYFLVKVVIRCSFKFYRTYFLSPCRVSDHP